jgi:hypothetical protein
MKLSVLKRIFDGWKCSTDITLNMNSSDPDDEVMRSHKKYPFGESRPDWMTYEDEHNMKEDFIAMRRLIREIEAQETTYVAVSILKDDEIGIKTGSEPESK